MGLEFGRSAEGDQAESAEEPEEEGTATSSAADTPDTYADSGASPAPRFSALWATPDASESSTTADPSDDADDSDDAKPSTSGPPTIPGTVVDSDTPETAPTLEASSARDDVDDPETSTAAEDSSTPDTVDAREASDADAAEEPAEDADASIPDADADVDAVSTEEPADDYEASGAAEVVSVPAQASPEDRTGRPSAVGTTAPAVPADEEATPVPESSADGGRPSVAARLEAAAGDLDGPLIGDVEGLRYSWQQIQIGFVDDPREAVVDAAVLVEHAAQALIGALQQRQRLLRGLWDSNTSLDGLGSPAPGSPTEPQTAGRARPTGDIPDTEDLRLLIQRYRTMFNEICRP